MGLHARKHVAAAPSDAASPTSGGGPSRLHKKSRFFVPSEWRLGVFSIAGFVVVALVLASVVIMHHHRKVALHIMANPWAHAGAALHGRVGFRHHFYSGAPRTVTVVMPSVVNPEKRTKRLDSILETWGPSARAIFVVHNVSEFPKASHAVWGPGLGLGLGLGLGPGSDHSTLENPHSPPRGLGPGPGQEHSTPEDPYSFPQLLLVPPGMDGVERLNYVIKTIHEKIDPQFAFYVNDHTFVIPEHLICFLKGEDPNKDMYVGHALKNDDMAFNSGAAGYVLSRATMAKLVQKWKTNHPKCVPNYDSTQGAKNKWLSGNPGLMTVQCLNEALGIRAEDTRLEGRWHRFHAFPITRLVSGNLDGWYFNKHKDMEDKIKTDESYSEILSGEDCCARDTISFHYVEYVESKAIFAVREALLENPKMPDHELKTMMVAEWPKLHSQIGGYSRRLPNDSDEKDWKNLLKVMRKISSRRTQCEY